MTLTRSKRLKVFAHDCRTALTDKARYITEGSVLRPKGAHILVTVKNISNRTVYLASSRYVPKVKAYPLSKEQSVSFFLLKGYQPDDIVVLS